MSSLFPHRCLGLLGFVHVFPCAAGVPTRAVVPEAVVLVVVDTVVLTIRVHFLSRTRVLVRARVLLRSCARTRLQVLGVHAGGVQQHHSVPV